MSNYLFISTTSLMVLYTCYHVLLRKEKVLTFNRFFLLGALVISLTLPFLEVPIEIDKNAGSAPIELISDLGQSISLDHEGAISGESEVQKHSSVNVELILWVVYWLGVAVMMLRFISGLARLMRLAMKSPCVAQHDIKVFITQEGIYPFSFFRWVFLQNESQLEEKEMMAHERAHVCCRHSLDVLLLEILLIIFWFQPLLYFYRKAISLNHEFTADMLAIRHSKDSNNYLLKVIKMSNHRPQLSLASSFSFVSLKNRVKMISKNESTKMTMVFKSSLALVVVMSVVVTFSFRLKPASVPVKKEFVVVVDAAHGGEDPGATSDNGIHEKDVVLKVAQALEKKLSESKIKVIMTRSDDHYLTLNERIALSGAADLYVSLHVETIKGSSERKRLIIYNQETPYADESMRIAGLVAHQFDSDDCELVWQSNYKVLTDPKCPSIMAIVGVFSNPEMESELSSESGQEEIAGKIAEAIQIVAL